MDRWHLWLPVVNNLVMGLISWQQEGRIFYQMSHSSSEPGLAGDSLAIQWQWSMLRRTAHSHSLPAAAVQSHVSQSEKTSLTSPHPILASSRELRNSRIAIVSEQDMDRRFDRNFETWCHYPRPRGHVCHEAETLPQNCIMNQNLPLSMPPTWKSCQLSTTSLELSLGDVESPCLGHGISSDHLFFPCTESLKIK